MTEPDPAKHSSQPHLADLARSDVGGASVSHEHGEGAAAPVRRVVLPGRPVQVDLPWEQATEKAADSRDAGSGEHPARIATDGAEESEAHQAEDVPERVRWTQDPVVRSTAEVLTWGALLAAVVGMVVFFRPLLSNAGDLRKQQVRVDIQWPALAGRVDAAPASPGEEPQTWVNAETRQILEALVLRSVSADPTDREAPTRARAALLRTGWFTPSLRVERDTSGVVRVFGESGAASLWRVPVAAVRYMGKDHLVGAEGERLPLAYEPGGSKFGVVVGVSTKEPEWGQVWPGGEVQAAIALMQAVQANPNFVAGTAGAKQFAAVDVSEFAKLKRLTIITDRGHRVLWGGPVDQLNPGEVKPAIKIERLATLLRNYGRIDAGHEMIDVRLEGGTFVVDREAEAAAGESPPRDRAGTKKPKTRQRAAVDRQ